MRTGRDGAVDQGGPARLAALARDAALLAWSRVEPRTALRCAPAPALALAVGLVSGHPVAGAIAAGGAVTVGFGAFQQFSSRAVPMVLAALGMAVSTLAGTLAGLSVPSEIAAVALWGCGCGALAALGPGAQWIAQQCTIFLVIAAAYPGVSAQAFERTWLVLAGGVLQLACFGAGLWFERGRPGAPQLQSLLKEAREEIAALRQDRQRIAFFRSFALRLAAVLATAVTLSRLLAIPNDYWIAMTALLLTRTGFRDTVMRSIARIVGTLLGAGLASGVVLLAQPGPGVLMALVLVFAFLSLATLRLGYGVFALSLTAYVMFLLTFAGLVETRVAEGRILSTMLGALCALAAHAHLRISDIKQAWQSEPGR
ncbi:MAG: FUSC family protein [Alphaproteobacteria bacterium]|nr:FUSC family protein [Alphaproteobacteria bacterium]